MIKVVHEIEKLLLPGWKMIPLGDSSYYGAVKHGPEIAGTVATQDVARTEDGRPLTVSVSVRIGSPTYNRFVRDLRAYGAIAPEPPKRRRKAVERHEPVQIKQATNPILLAKGVLQDQHATPRERKLAREYLSLMERHQEIRELASKLGQRLSEITKELEES